MEINTLNTVLIAIAQISATLTGLVFVALTFHFKSPDKIKKNLNTPFTPIFVNLFMPTIFGLLAVLVPWIMKLLVLSQFILFILCCAGAFSTVRNKGLSHYVIFLAPVILNLMFFYFGKNLELLVFLALALIYQISFAALQVWVIFRNL